MSHSSKFKIVVFSFENLCLDIEEQLQKQGDNSKFGNLDNDVQIALNVAESLDIISLSNKTIKVSFHFRAQDALNLVNSLFSSSTGCERNVTNPILNDAKAMYNYSSAKSHTLQVPQKQMFC